MTTIYEQLKDYCDCIKLSDVSNKNFDLWVNNLIDLVSIRTCWKNNPCETFLSSDREEVFTVDIPTVCGCNNGIYEFDLFYKEVKECSIDVVIQLKEGIDFTEISVGTENYSYDVYENKLYVDISEYISNSRCNPIKVNRIIVRYIAGYEKIPECLIPMFCDMLKQVIELNRCDCVCDTCEDETVEEEKVMDTIDEYIQQSIFMAYARQLETITLCKGKRQFKGMVV